MKKRILCLVAVFLVVLLSFSATVLAQSDEYTITINLVAKFSSARGQTFLAYFSNIETGETICFDLIRSESNVFLGSRFPEGEYELVKCVLEKDESIEFEVASMPKNLFIEEGEDTYYTFRIEESSDFVGTEDWKKVQNQHVLETIAAIMLLMLVPVGIVWIVFAIIGRKNLHKKAIAKLILHIFFAMFGAIVGIVVAPEFNVPAVIPIVFCICFPYGPFAVAWIRFKASGREYETAEKRTLREERAQIDFERRLEDDKYASEFERTARTTKGCLGTVLLLILCSILGVIACPVVLVKDIVDIVQTRDLNYRIK